jgi:WD40 repeat protein
MGLSIVKVLRTAIVTLLLAMLHLSQLQAQDRGKGHLSGTRHLAFSPDGRLLAATYGGIDQPGTLRIWDLQTGAMVREHQEPVGVCFVSFSPDGDSVAIGMFGKVGKVLDVTTGNVQFELRGHESHVRSIAYVDEGVIATGSYDKTIRLWNAQTGVQISQLGQPTDELRTIAVSPNGQYLLSGSASPNCRLWDLAEMKEVALFESPNFICPNVCFSRDGEFFLTGSWDGIVRIREVASQRLRAAVMASALRALDMSPDNSLLLGCSDKGAGSLCIVPFRRWRHFGLFCRQALLRRYSDWRNPPRCIAWRRPQLSIDR